jgi:hypothetical protein
MAEVKAYPYLTVEASHIAVTGNWVYSNGEGHVDLELLLRNWDVASNLEAEITLRVDLKHILQDCGLGEDAILRLAIGWRSSGTMLRGNGTRIDLNSLHAKQQMTLRVQVSGTEVSHDITLFVALILISAGQNAHKLSPNIPGSVLWINENRLPLNDTGLHFPTEIIDFRNRDWKVPSNSAWYLEWNSSDLHQTIFGDIQLYLNASHSTVINAIVSDQSLSDIFQQFLFFDVARMLIEGALTNTDFVEDPTQFPEGSIGFLIHNIFREYFSTETPASLLRKSNDKNLFEAILQHNLSFLKT